jgi:hypothetical protein
VSQVSKPDELMANEQRWSQVTRCEHLVEIVQYFRFHVFVALSKDLVDVRKGLDNHLVALINPFETK